MCNCKATEIVVALVVLVFSFYQTTYSNWVVIVAAAVLLIHGLGCKDIVCGASAKPKAKKKRKR